MTTTAFRIPGPPELLPGRPDAVIDLQSKEGLDLVGATWRYSDAAVSEVDFVTVGEDLGPSGVPNRTYEISPAAGVVDFDDAGWTVLEPADTMLRLSTGKVCFNWYRIAVTIPPRVGVFDPAGATAVFEVVVDDYAEVWVNGELPVALGDSGGNVVAGFNAPNRVVLGRNVQPGDRFEIAILGINGPISAAPRNYIWIRSATIDLYSATRAKPSAAVEGEIDVVDAMLRRLLDPDEAIEKVAGGFEFTEGPVWTADGALLFSSPNTNVIYRWHPTGRVTVFRTKSGYSGFDIGRYAQPGSNGLAFDPQGRLTICQHGNRRIVRVEPRGNVTVLADAYDDRRLNSPNDLVYRSDGTLFFTDPPFGLPAMFDDPDKELDFSGVFSVAPEGRVSLVTDELSGPNGIALSPDERFLYVGNWDADRKVVMRYVLGPDGTVGPGAVVHDMTGADGDDAIDGLKVDKEGNLYVCGPGGVWVLAGDGRHLGTIRLPEAPHNLAWGDADARGLYITALTSVYRVRTIVPGFGARSSS